MMVQTVVANQYDGVDASVSSDERWRYDFCLCTVAPSLQAPRLAGPGAGAGPEGIPDARWAEARWATTQWTAARRFGCGHRRPERAGSLRPSAWPPRPVLHRGVGTVLLIRHARVAAVLHVR